MIFTADRDALRAALQVLQQVLPARSTMPVYQNVKAVAGERLTLMATDLEVGIRYDLAGPAVEEPGAAILPAARLAAILRECPDAEVRIDADAARVIVKTSVSDYELPTQAPESFSDVAAFDPVAGYHELDAGNLARLVERTVFAAARDDGKYAMRGVLWDLAGTQARLVGTDSKRIAIADAPCVTVGGDPAADRPSSHLVPPKAMKLLAQLLAAGDATAPVRLSLRTNDALFKTERAVVCSQLVEGRFPAYQQAIPRSPKTSLTLVAGDFLAAVRQAAVMTDEASKRVDIRFESGRATLRVARPDVGSGEVRAALPADGWAGPPASLAFEANWITEFLRLVPPAEVVRLGVVDRTKGLFTVGDDFTYLVASMVEGKS
jgi:DNA polymerase-3 subunit beta